MFEQLLSRRGLSLERLHALAQVADAKSMAKAANGDRNRQSTFSKTLRQLENFFGEKLTEKNGKHLRLNPRGVRLAELAREILHGLNDFDATARNQPTTIAFGAGDSLLHWLVLPRLGEIQAKLPKSLISLKNCRNKDVIEGLTDLNLDLGLVSQEYITARLKGTVVLKLKYHLFAPLALLPKNQKCDARWVLENLPLAFQTSADELHKTLESDAKKTKTKLNIKLCCNSYPQVFKAVRSGKYAGVLPSVAAGELETSEFAKLPAPVKAQERQICLAWHPRLAERRDGFEKIRRAFETSLRQTIIR